MSNASGVREFLQITEENAYKTFNGAVSRGTNQIAIALQEGNAFTMRPRPVKINIPYGGGLAVRKASVSDKTELKGKLRTLLTYSQASLLLGAGLTRINGAQTAPWTTTEPIGDLASFTIDHGIYRDDTGDYKRTRYLGCKITGGSIEVSEDSETTVLDLDIVGSTPQGNTFDSSSDPGSSPFPIPADSDYATDYVLFSHSGGNLTRNNAAFAEYTRLKVSWENVIDAKYFANRFVQKVRCYGRQLMLDSDIVLRASPNFRSSYYELTTALDETKLVFNNGTHNITLDFYTNALIDSLEDDTSLEKLYGRKLQLISGYDTGNTADFAFSYS